MNNFDEFDRTSRRARNIAMFAGFGALILIWMLFLMGAISAGIFIAGRVLSVW